MQKINILHTSEVSGGSQPFEHDDLKVRFYPLNAAVDVPLIEGRIMAFVDQFLPEISGTEVCRRLRCHPLTAHSHITMVLEAADIEAGKMAMRAGADDYVPGPIGRSMMLDRVMGAIMNPYSEIPSQTIEVDGLCIDLAAYLVRWQGKPVPLRLTEFRLLRFMLEHPGRVFTRFQLIAALGKQDPPIDERTVDVWIGRLRRSLRAAGAGDRIRTVRQLGYVLDRPE